jgi:hypothetical protein
MMTKKDYKATAIIFMAFFLLLVGGNLTLVSCFDFPDILRKSAMERFTLFQQNQGTIVPAYYAMGLTSLIQIFMAAMMFHLTKKNRMIDILALTAGVLSGVFQVLGFFRWVILMPMLSNTLNSKEISSNIIFFLEKFANTYMGMTVGEHLGTLFTGLWLLLLGIAMINNTSFDKKLTMLGLFSGIMLMIQSFETVTGNEFLGYITTVVWGLYAVWVLIISIMMFQRKDETSRQKVQLWAWVLGLVIYLANVVPSLI